MLKRLLFVAIMASALLSTHRVEGRIVADVAVVERGRSEILPYNSDSLYVKGNINASLYIDEIREWERDGMLFSSQYTFPFEWLNRAVLVRLEYVGAPYMLLVNDEIVAICYDGNSPAEYNLTDFTLEGLNTIAILIVDKAGSLMLDGWRKVAIEAESIELGRVTITAPAKMTIRDIEVETRLRDFSLSSEIAIDIKNYNLNERTSILRYRLSDPNGDSAARGSEELTLSLRGEDTLHIAAIVAKRYAWSAESPQMYELNMSLQQDGWYREFHRYRLGLRSVEVDERGAMFINGIEVALRGVEVDKVLSEDDIVELKRQGVNLIYIGAGVRLDSMLEMCDRLGMYAIVTAPINSREGGESIAIGGNPTNDRDWLESYWERIERCYYTTRRHPSVVGYALAEESMNGYNLYESYLKMKSIEQSLPIIYRDGGGEWNSDILNIEFRDEE